MSLMIGLIIFISGVETARDIKVLNVAACSYINPAKMFVHPGWLYSSCNSSTLFLPGCICVDAV